MRFTIQFILYLTFLLPLTATDKAESISNIQELVDHWDKDQHLYVKGKLGINKNDLNQLEKWLDKHGKNWTIVLMRSAQGERWKNQRGQEYYGMDAVEYATGKGLSNKTNFSEQKHPKTKTRNGAIFILFLNERKFSYFSSDAYDSNQLGQMQWQGNLDEKAINAMRNGGRILDAVKDTVTSIDKQLARKIKLAEQRAARAEAEKLAAIEWVKREAKAQQILLDELEEELGRFRKNADVKEGDLANPPINDWLEILQNNSTIAPSGDPYTAKSALISVGKEIKDHRSKIREWSNNTARIASLRQSIDGFKPHPSQDKGEDGALATLKTSIAKTEQLHKKGEQNYLGEFYQTENLLKAIEEDKESILKKIRLEQAAQKEANERKKIAIVTGSGATGVGLLGLGIYSNRRRRKNKAIAQQLYAEWKEAMKVRVDKLFKTMDNAALIVGSERDLPQRGYEGTTLEESISAIRNIDKAFVLTSSVDTALETAKKLIYPTGILSKAGNTFRRTHYDEAIELLERRPLKADPEKQVMKVANRGEETMLGDKTKAEKVDMKFTDLIQKFDTTLSDAQQSLRTVETAWSTIAARTETLGKNLDAINVEEVAIDKAGSQDSLFLLDQLFDHWHPSAEEIHQRGINMGKHDPVRALQTDIARAEIMTNEMNQTIQLVNDLRKTELSPTLAHAHSLEKHGQDTQWIEQELDAINKRFEEISKLGIDGEITEQLVTLKQQVYALQPRAAMSEKLAYYAKHTLPKDAQEAAELVTAARENISNKLDLSPDNILCEHDRWNPDIILAKAELARTTAVQLIDRGHALEAQEQTNLADALIANANDVVNESLTAHKTFSTTLATAQELQEEAKEKRINGIHVMNELLETYSNQALQIDPQDDTFGNLTEVEEALIGAERQIISDIDHAQEHHSWGHVLSAKHNLENAQRVFIHISGLEETILARKAELHELEQKNSQLLETAKRSKESLQNAIGDHRVSAETQTYFDQFKSHYNYTKRAVSATRGESNPFHAKHLLAEAKERIDALESAILSDHEAFAAAESAHTRLENLQDQALESVTKARRDSITDSRLTTTSIETIREAKAAITAHFDRLQKPHQDWQDLYRDIQLTNEQVSQAKFTLNQELERAQQALASIRNANSNVSQAMHWSGSYGVRITGSYGRNSLSSAQEALEDGHYQQASSLASQAINAAHSAISSAESEVSRIRRARAAEARRERQRRRNSSSSMSFGSSSSGSSFGSFGSSSGGSSFGSSSGSSSSGSSGSGFSRSGW